MKNENPILQPMFQMKHIDCLNCIQFKQEAVRPHLARARERCTPNCRRRTKTTHIAHNANNPIAERDPYPKQT